MQEGIYAGTGSKNYTHLDDGGDIQQHGTAQIIWTKITADNITQGNGGHGASALSDLQTAHDGNFYHIDETATDPGFELTIEFVNVTSFNWVSCLAVYDGSIAHAVNISLYNFTQTRWDCFDAFSPAQAEVSTADEYTMQNHDFLVPDYTEYIGTGGDDGDVRVKIAHEITGNANHDIDIDCIALYQ